MNENVRVLLVEDDDAERTALAAVLGLEPTYEVITAEDGIRALEIAQENPPDIIVSDIYMPGMNGLELCKRIKSDSQLKNTMVILISSSAEVKDRVEGFDSGVDDYVPKPVHVDELLARVRATLRVKFVNDELSQERKALEDMNRVLEESYSGILQLLVQLIGLRIPNATARAERAEAMARWIGQKLQMDDASLHVLGTAAKLHEIGKLSFPDAQLKQDPATWSDEQWNEARNFTTFGNLMLAGFPKLKEVASLVRHQLENYDGTGYPDKLIHQQIPLGSRILRLVNYIERHPVSASLSRDGQIEKIRKAKSTILDPYVVQLTEEYLLVIEDPAWLEGKKQVSILELKPGMVLAHDLTTGSGVKLLSREAVVTMGQIERILSHHQGDPIVNSIYIHDKSY
jgi:response regulator RpfG family c-di-GMP phosphodiesterase